MSRRLRQSTPIRHHLPQLVGVPDEALLLSCFLVRVRLYELAGTDGGRRGHRNYDGEAERGTIHRSAARDGSRRRHAGHGVIGWHALVGQWWVHKGIYDECETFPRPRGPVATDVRQSDAAAPLTQTSEGSREDAYNDGSPQTTG